MFGIEFIEVGIGLVFGFLAISTICSGVVEIFNKATKMKSRHLKTALGQLLDDPKYNGFVKELYDHHLISSPLAKKMGSPDYIEAKDFASAVFDILGGAAESVLYKSMLMKVEKMPDGEIKTDLLAILNASPEDLKVMKQDVGTYFTNPEFQIAVCKLLASYSAGTKPYKALIARVSEADGEAKDELTKIINSKPADIDGMKTEILGWFGNTAFDEALFDLLAFCTKELQSYEKIEERINTIRDKGVRDRLLTILESSATELESMRAKVETWFDNTMEQVSDWYRKKMRIFVTLVSVVVVISMNADSVRLARELWYDNELREATIAAASDYVKVESAKYSSVNTPVLTPSKVLADTVGDSTASRLATPVTKDTLETTQDQIADFSNMLDSLKGDIKTAQMLPIGWATEVLPWQKAWPQDKDNDKDLFWWWLSKILGLLITIGAVSFGSTYWYSQLKSLLNLRFNMTGKPANTTTIVNNPAPKEPETKT